MDLNCWTKGQRAGPFTIQRRLGSGYEAVVYAVRDPRDGKLRTLKLFKGSNVLADVEHTFRHWQRYAGLDCVKQCLEIGVLRGQRRVSERPWLLMTYVPGVTLAEQVERGRVRDPTALAIHLLQAMVPIHTRGLGLGDLDKGRNVVIERGTGRMVFIDLDAGTPGHPPPEIYEDLLEVLWLARRCGRPALSRSFVSALECSPNARAALTLIEGTGRFPTTRGLR
jgi:RIO-like serine/threonine protein kinase